MSGGCENCGVRLDRLPLTYDECRARFRRAATDHGLAVEAHPIEARGPHGQQLTVDVVAVGAVRPRRALVVMSGVHGVEGFVGSALQCELLAHLDDLPGEVAVIVVHAVNPWGMAWGRRQNESNVDLNRNWRRSDVEPVHNEAYDQLHHLACPDPPELPSVEDLLVQAAALVEERGLPWVRDGITRGQYRHPDGLHFGGDRTEASCRIVERELLPRLDRVRQLLTIDLHTGHGPRGEVVLLSDQPPTSDQHSFFTARFPGTTVEATADNPDATTGAKSGQIATGFRDALPGATCFATSVEFGTVGDEEQLAATFLAHWVWRHGDLGRPEHAAVWRQYRDCFTPDDAAWEAAALAGGRRVLDRAVDAVRSWA
jgi:predicted deacylase